jgi:hypothetical protein
MSVTALIHLILDFEYDQHHSKMYFVTFQPVYADDCIWMGMPLAGHAMVMAGFLE